MSDIQDSQFSFILHPSNLQHLIRQWLREDTPSFDYGGFVVGEHEKTAVLLMKSPGILAGIPFFNAVFNELGCTVNWFVEEGWSITPITRVAEVTGKVRQILLGERVALNCISRISGIATLAKKLSLQVREVGWKGQIAGTRKTTPGFRLAEKYGLLVGGVSTHRYDLSSMIMLKDNHIWAAGDITKAVKSAKVVGGFSSKVEVECRVLEEGKEAATAGADVLMLDNFSPRAQDAANVLKKAYPHVLIEASGGITDDNIIDFCCDAIDIISLGKLTQGYDCVDFSLKVLKEQ